MERSVSIKSIASALVKFNSLVGKIPKDSKNPFFKSNYADLSTILDIINPILIECGLAIVQFPKGVHELETMVMHGESGEYISECYTMVPVKADPQSVGSCITYQRRYSLAAVLSLNIDNDDDGNKASRPVEKVAPPAPVTPKPLMALSDEKFQNALASDDVEKIDGLIAILTSGKTHVATKEQMIALNERVIALRRAAEESVPKAPKNTPKEAQWLTTTQLNAALESSATKIQSTLNAIEKGTYKAREMDVELLKEKLQQLKDGKDKK